MNHVNEHLRNLKPRERVYEFPLNSRLALRVFPNGTKVWVFWRNPARHPRGRTIGVFPQMNAEHALGDSGTVIEIGPLLEEAELRVPDDDQFEATGNYFERRRVSRSRNRWLRSGATLGMLTLAAVLGLQSLVPPDEVSAEFGAVPTMRPAIYVPDDYPVPRLGRQPGARQSPSTGSRSGGQPPRTAQPDEGLTIGRGGVVRRVSEAQSTSAGDSREDLGDQVARAVLTTSVSDHEPDDELGPRIVAPDSEELQVYFFTELRGLDGQRVTHRWLWRGQSQASRAFEVRNDRRWRIWSGKSLPPDMTGDWEVQVLAADGRLLASHHFRLADPDHERIPPSPGSRQ